MKCKYLTLLASMAFAAFLLGPSPASAAAAPPSLGSAGSFAVLGGPAVTCTASIVTGDVGSSGAMASVVQTEGCTITGAIVAPVPTPVVTDFLTAYDAIADNTVTAVYPCTGSLETVYTDTALTLTPGVYCNAAAVTFTRTLLTLEGPADGLWIFKIGTGGTGALTGTNFSVIRSGAATCDNNVFWWTKQAATLTDSFVVGNILSGAAITVTRGSLDGRALAVAAVTLTGTDVSACGGGTTPGGQCGTKVTGGGQIPVPDTDSKGRATFGFSAKGNEDGTGSGHFNYVNHKTGLHVNGPVENVAVIARNPDGSPKTVRFSGSCDDKLPACSFSVTVEDHGEPGTKDQFGVAVTGGLSEFRSQRVISRGNIQFHKSHCDCQGKDKRRGGHDDNDGDTCDDGDGHDHDGDGHGHNGDGDDHPHGDGCGKGKRDH